MKPFKFNQKPIGRLMLIALLLGFASLGFSEVSTDFQTANQFYDQGKFSEAKQGYESIQRTGNQSAALYYNLGNTEFRLNHPGSAILNYERALALEPSHPEAVANLAFVRAKTGAKTENLNWRLFPPFSINHYTLVATLAGWIFLFSLATLPFKRKSSTSWFIAIPALLIAIYSTGALWFYDKDRTLAVVTADHAKAQFAPADSSSITETLPVGSTVRVLRNRGAWVFCQLPNKNTGWMTAHSIQSVR